MWNDTLLCTNNSYWVVNNCPSLHCVLIHVIRFGSEFDLWFCFANDNLHCSELYRIQNSLNKSTIVHTNDGYKTSFFSNLDRESQKSIPDTTYSTSWYQLPRLLQRKIINYILPTQHFYFCFSSVTCHKTRIIFQYNNFLNNNNLALKKFTSELFNK